MVSRFSRVRLIGLLRDVRTLGRTSNRNADGAPRRLEQFSESCSGPGPGVRRGRTISPSAPGVARRGKTPRRQSARILATFRRGGMAEWSMAVILKSTALRRGSPKHFPNLLLQRLWHLRDRTITYAAASSQLRKSSRTPSQLRMGDLSHRDRRFNSQIALAH